MKPDIIFVTGDFPSIGGDSDPEGTYFYKIARYIIEETGMRRIGESEYSV